MNKIDIYHKLPLLLARWSSRLQIWGQPDLSHRPCPSSGRCWPPMIHQWFLWMLARLTLPR